MRAYAKHTCNQLKGLLIRLSSHAKIGFLFVTLDGCENMRDRVVCEPSMRLRIRYQTERCIGVENIFEKYIVYSESGLQLWDDYEERLGFSTPRIPRV